MGATRQQTRSDAGIPWRDAAVVFALTVLTLVLSVRWQLNESLFAFTRHWEYVQADELPIAMLVLSVGLIWLAWRRYRHASRELAARRITEARLAAVLAENRTLAQEHLRIQEVERKHLARELHDELGQYLNAIKLDAVAVRDACEPHDAAAAGGDAARCREAAVAIVRAVDHVHAAVSGMIARLRPVGLDELGLVAAIEHCLDHWRERQPATRFSLKVQGEFADLPEPLTLTVYRVIQESLTNVHKHARARRVEVALERVAAGGAGAGEVRLTVADDGCGMAMDLPPGRLGFRGMRERVEMDGGTFILESAPGRGVRVGARLAVPET